MEIIHTKKMARQWGDQSSQKLIDVYEIGPIQVGVDKMDIEPDLYACSVKGVILKKDGTLEDVVFKDVGSAQASFEFVTKTISDNKWVHDEEEIKLDKSNIRGLFGQ